MHGNPLLIVRGRRGVQNCKPHSDSVRLKCHFIRSASALFPLHRSVCHLKYQIIFISLHHHFLCPAAQTEEWHDTWHFHLDSSFSTVYYNAKNNKWVIFPAFQHQNIVCWIAQWLKHISQQTLSSDKSFQFSKIFFKLYYYPNVIRLNVSNDTEFLPCCCITFLKFFFTSVTSIIRTCSFKVALVMLRGV